MIDYRIQAEKILKLVGGCENVISLSHCFTRLRFVLKNPDAVQEEELRKLESVRGILNRPGSYQIVIGVEVTAIYRELEPIYRTEKR